MRMASGGHAGEDVAGELGAGQREEGERQREPEEHEEVGRATCAGRARNEGGQHEPRPGEEPGQQDGQVVPEGAGVVVDGRGEALDVVVEDEDVEEVPALVERGSRRTRGGHEREGQGRRRREDLPQPPPLAGGERGSRRGRGAGSSRPSGPLARVARPAAAARGHDREAPGDAQHPEAREADRERSPWPRAACPSRRRGRRRRAGATVPATKPACRPAAVP